MRRRRAPQSFGGPGRPGRGVADQFFKHGSLAFEAGDESFKRAALVGDGLHGFGMAAFVGLALFLQGFALLLGAVLVGPDHGADAVPDAGGGFLPGHPGDRPRG